MFALIKMRRLSGKKKEKKSGYYQKKETKISAQKEKKISDYYKKEKRKSSLLCPARIEFTPFRMKEWVTLPTELQ